MEFDHGIHLGSGTTHNIVAGTRSQLNKDAGIQLCNADDGARATCFAPTR